jgi:prophage maintenance system killer protein
LTDGHYVLTWYDATWSNNRVLRNDELHEVAFPDQLEAALARPYSGYMPELAQKAAAVVQSFAGSQIFANGNKRTAVFLVVLLIRKSGYNLHPYGNRRLADEVEELMLDTVRSTKSSDGSRCGCGDCSLEPHTCTGAGGCHSPERKNRADVVRRYL